MPDQTSAAKEHAIMQEITAPLADLPQDPVGTVANQDFPIVLRGYDRMAVDAFVKHTAQLVAELHATRSPEGAVRRALERVGSEVSSILQRAHDTAEEITTKSRSEAEDRMDTARSEAAELIRAAERRVQELDADVDRIWAERDKIVADVRKLSEELELLAGAAATRFPAAPEETEPLGPEPTEGVAGAGGASSEEPFGAGPGDIFEGPADIADGAAGTPAESEAEPPVGAGPDTVEQPPEGHEPSAAFVDPVDGVAKPPFAAHQVSVPEPPDDEPTIVKGQAAVVRPPDFRVIDLLHLGRERVIGCSKVEDVLIDPGPASCVPTLLDALADERPRALLLTHIHLDHAGASGSLIERWPDLEVYVHELGAPHLMDPGKLLDSARRLYGADMERLWGEVLPVPVENVRIVRGGEQLLGGGFEVAYTPGHASHHVAYVHDGTAFVGDAGGVRIASHGLVIPPAPPPDIDVEAWHDSIELIRASRPERLVMTHFGASEDVDAQLVELSERLDNWAALARTEEMETFIATVTEEIERGAGGELLAAYAHAAPPEQTYAGLRRYWEKRSQRDDEAPAQASTHAGRAARPPGPGSGGMGGAGELS
jgi:glyoxylase-like metal-dependent hydrolase (beta-lactamase superfamily II)/vacuolar-type H+-ATPase subunit H